MLLFYSIVGIITLVIIFFYYFAIGTSIGYSMYPTLDSFEVILVKKKKYDLEVGKVYIFQMEEEAFPFIKRLAEISDEGLYFLGDNPDHSYDSRNFGYVSPSTVIGEAIKLKFWRKL